MNKTLSPESKILLDTFYHHYTLRTQHGLSHDDAACFTFQDIEILKDLFSCMSQSKIDELLTYHYIKFEQHLGRCIVLTSNTFYLYKKK